MGISWSSYTPPPDYPYTARDDVCGGFRDTFEWETLGEDYLREIGHHASIGE